MADAPAPPDSPAPRRRALIEQATDYALAHGLVGLSLRPLAAALGTSDRMLIYHLGSKDQLVVEIIRETTRRSVAELRALPAAADPHAAVLAQWALRTTPRQQQCERLYVEASTLGLFGKEPYASEVAQSNDEWTAAVRDHLAASGVPGDRVAGAAALVDAAFMGFELDTPLHADQVARGVGAIAESIALLSGR